MAQPNLAERVARLEARAERAGMDINGLYELHNELRGDISQLQNQMYLKIDEIKVLLALRLDEMRKERNSVTERILLLLVGALVSGIATYLLKS